MKKIVTVSAIVGILCFGYVFAYINNMANAAQKSEYPTNEKGQSYEKVPINAEDEPELIAVIGENNVEGYVKKSDLDNDGDVKTPEEALKRQKEMRKNPNVSIPVYKNDGETVIGAFLLSTQNEQSLY